MTNEEVYYRADENNGLQKTLRKKKMELIGHIMRHDNLLKMIKAGMLRGKRCKGKPHLQYGFILPNSYLETK